MHCWCIYQNQSKYSATDQDNLTSIVKGKEFYQPEAPELRICYDSLWDN